MTFIAILVGNNSDELLPFPTVECNRCPTLLPLLTLNC